jgi:hypothetical protein
MSMKQIKTLLIDDIDGSEADGTVRFALDGVSYEIDLSDAHMRELRGALAPFVAKATKGRAKPAERARFAEQARERSAEIRAWAELHGLTLNKRGRIPAEVVKQFEQGYPDKPLQPAQVEERVSEAKTKPKRKPRARASVPAPPGPVFQSAG